MDKIAGLKEILAQDAKNSFARYGLAMELAGRGETEAALVEFDICWLTIPDTPPATSWQRKRLRCGPQAGCHRTFESRHPIASRKGDRHAAREMQAMLDELDG